MTLPLSLVITHFIGDFLLQTDMMALNKSKHLHWLTLHCLTYSLTFLLLGFGWKFWLLTFYSHMAVDYVTSRITSRLWFIEIHAHGDSIDNGGWFEGRLLPTRHWFFVAIGADQLIHFVTLAITWSLL